jgi:anti-sigma regulatory factor (Ser/Thr protein kinase)
LISERRSQCEIRASLPATLDAVEAFFRDFRSRAVCREHPGAAFVAELLLREALVNAVTHGSAGNPEMSVRCVARLRGVNLTIAVIDEGPGFNWRDVSRRQPFPWGGSGRGLGILRAYSTMMRFNEKGNAVILWRRF